MVSVARKRSKGSERPSAVPEETGSRGREVVGLAMLLMALGLCFALFSYEPGDAQGKRNLVGPLGAWVAATVLRAVGIIGYLTGIAAVLFAGIVLFGRLRWPSFRSIVAVVSIVTGGAILAHLWAVDAGPTPYPPGGLLGLVLGSLLRREAGPAGALLAGLGLVSIGLVTTFRISVRRAVTSGFGWLRRGAHDIWLRYRIGRDARRAARQRQRELLEAAQEEREESKRKARLQEQARRQAFDERARVAVLKATARAEERALAQIETERSVVWSPASSSSPGGASATASRAGPSPSASRAGPSPSASRAGPSPSASRAGTSPSASRAGASRPGVDPEGPSTLPPAPISVDVGLPSQRSGPAPIIDASLIDDEDDFLSSGPAVLEDAADVVDRIDRGETVTEERVPSVLPSADEEDIEDAEVEPIDDEEEEEAIDGEVSDLVEALQADDGDEDEPSEELDEDLIIHERKAMETDFADEPSQRVASAPQRPAFVLPPINLLDYEGDGPEPVDQAALKVRATRLEEKLKTYGVEGKVMAIRPGPVVTTYEYQPAPGVKVAKIANLADDIAMSMEAVRVRIVAPIPGRGVVGIELPNESRENVYLKEIIAHEAFKHQNSLLTLALGKDAEGEPQVRDLRKMPHLMIAGTTGSGKSVSINTMVLSMLYKATPDEVKFIMVDPKMLELSLYNDIPHLLLPVVTDPKKASLALAWTVDEMERRYKLLSSAKVRDIQGFNKKVAKLNEQRAKDAGRRRKRQDELGAANDPMASFTSDLDEPPPSEGQRLADPWGGDDVPEPLPFIVVLIDEFADLMMAAPRDVEASVQRLAQKARAAGIHVLLATQRPSTDVITGVIKNNFPSRLAFRVASRHDSATVLNTPGAENLLGMGDSLFLSVASPNPVRVHGAFVSEDEVERVVEFWKEQAKPTYDPTILQRKEEDNAGFDEEDVDELYDAAVRFVAETRKASISAVQRKLRVGYNRAARMIEMMEAQGIVGPVQGPKGEREILVSAMGPDGPERS